MQLSAFSLALPLAVLSVSAALAQQPDSPPAPAATAPAATPVPATMFKLGLDVPRIWADYWGIALPVYVGVERQLGQHWSLTTDLNASLGGGFRYRGVELKRFGAMLGTRYYYSQARRQRKGKSVAALGGTYLQLQLASEFTGHYGYDFYPNDRLYYRHEPKLELLWGYQRRLGRHGFMDVGAGLNAYRDQRYRYDNGNFRNYRTLALEPTLRARIGLAL